MQPPTKSVWPKGDWLTLYNSIKQQMFEILPNLASLDAIKLIMTLCGSHIEKPVNLMKSL